jgi:hypothetical protein
MVADGSIHELQRRCLLGLGAWLDVNGEAIHGSRPWTRAESMTRDGIPVRFTQKQTTLYAMLLEMSQSPSSARPEVNSMSLRSEWNPPGRRVRRSMLRIAGAYFYWARARIALPRTRPRRWCSRPSQHLVPEPEFVVQLHNRAEYNAEAHELSMLFVAQQGQLVHGHRYRRLPDWQGY